MNEYDKKLLYITIPTFLLLSGLIIALSLLYVKVYDNGSTSEQEMILLSLKDISFSSYLQRDTTNQNLIKFYEEINDEPYIDIYFSYNTLPDGLKFRILDQDGDVVSGDRTIAVEKMGHSKWRYPFTNNGSSFYNLQYTLSNNVSNINNIAITRVEVLA